LDELASRILSFRATKNMTQKELAKEIGINYQVILSMENNKIKTQIRSVTRRKIELYLDNN